MTDLVCLNCGGPLPTERHKKWCSNRCKKQFRSPPAKDGKRNRITDEAIARAKEKYPSLNRDWTAEMVDECFDRILEILQKRKF